MIWNPKNKPLGITAINLWVAEMRYFALNYDI